MKSLSYKPDNKIYCGISGMTPGEFVEIVTNYFKSFDKNYIPSRNTLSDIFDMVKGKKQGFSRSVIVKTAQDYFQKSLR
ncbi:MAG: hypothetical protein WA139_02310 [Candidatus Aenigmatarchaeota archaeon]